MGPTSRSTSIISTMGANAEFLKRRYCNRPEDACGITREEKVPRFEEVLARYPEWSTLDKHEILIKILEGAHEGSVEMSDKKMNSTYGTRSSKYISSRDNEGEVEMPSDLIPYAPNRHNARE